MMVIGEYPTAGVEAEVSRGQFKLPEGMSLQVPFGRFVLPDGSLFLEGQGVKPTVKVPIDATTAVSTDDEVLKAATAAVLGQSPQGGQPTQPQASEPLPPASGAPTIESKDQSMSALTSGKPALEDKAAEKYQGSDYAQPGKLAFTVGLAPSDEVVWLYAWCATTQPVLVDNFKSIKLKFMLDGKDVSSQMNTADLPNSGRQCRLYFSALSNWPAGSHHISTTATFTQKINDGSSDYAAGDYVLDYTVNVR